MNNNKTVTAESMGRVLALARALHAKDRTTGELFMPSTHAEAVRLLVGAYACLRLLLSDPRLSTSTTREAARLAVQATVPEQGKPADSSKCSPRTSTSRARTKNSKHSTQRHWQ